MTAKVILCVFAALGTEAATTCMMYRCDSTLQTNVCATWPSGQLIKVNVNGCDSSHYCSAPGMVAWAESTTDSTNVYPCGEVPTAQPSKDFTEVTCPQPETDKNFISGATTPATCTNYLDCKLVDGSYADCVCALRTDGYGTCQPDRSNTDVFKGYWDECGSEGKITSEVAAVYWSAYMSYWVYYNADLPCKSVFLECQEVEEAESDYNAAGYLAATGACLCLLG